jgi:hypothetical protein
MPVVDQRGWSPAASFSADRRLAGGRAFSHANHRDDRPPVQSLGLLGRYSRHEQLHHFYILSDPAKGSGHPSPSSDPSPVSLRPSTYPLPPPTGRLRCQLTGRTSAVLSTPRSAARVVSYSRYFAVLGVWPLTHRSDVTSFYYFRTTQPRLEHDR